jgi:lipopolysaccharide/colanic/teichoic acid biosynthesis glycosyltransferase
LQSGKAVAVEVPVSLSSRASSYTGVQPPETSPGLFQEPACAGFYRRSGKRAVDICASLVALIALSPLFLVLAILIKLTSRGPVFYRQNRVGRDARIFRILKFRSMVVDADRQGLGITAAEDERVTPFGKFLRELKLDETPQFWNVLKGDMSLVGPRPELPSYVAHYTPEQLRVLSVKPGITDIASIRYRHEEKLLKRSADPDELYRHLILPKKLALNLQYIHCMSLALDLKLILETLRSIAL